MISFALMLMTLPSRMAEVRAGRADRAERGDRVGLPDSSRERSGYNGMRLDNPSFRQEQRQSGSDRQLQQGAMTLWRR